jgi:hypothetical protein
MAKLAIMAEPRYGRGPSRPGRPRALRSGPGCGAFWKVRAGSPEHAAMIWSRWARCSGAASPSS